MPAAGKSTVGVLLAKKMGLSYIDTDIGIQQQQNSKLPDIIAKKGMDGFLETESAYACSLSVASTVIATGGSIVYSDTEMQHLKSNGICIYLQTDPAFLEQRIESYTTRGIVRKKGQDIHSLFNDRKKLYQKYADITIDCNEKSPAETVNLILMALDTNYERSV